MTFIIVLTTVFHIFACLALVMIVLLQTGKGADIGASMGGAGSQALFGSSGTTTLLSKITTGIAILFMLTSLFLAYHSGHRTTESLMDDVTPVVEQTVPGATIPDAAPVETPAGSEPTLPESAE
ncbi:MAG: preprotein translocase subunit SecG [Proteobacteria bacterium]|nr:preprotein translocase subunit SecG [Pseudomonadota bacterium]